MGISIIGAPVSVGAYAPGQEEAPAALRAARLIEQLTAAGLDVSDLGDTDRFRWRVDRASPRSMNARLVNAAAREVAEKTGPAFAAGGKVLVIGGDCTVEIGTVAAASDGRSFGLIYIDLDADLNTPESTADGALDWMGVAHLLGIDGVDPRVTEGLGPEPLLRPEQLLYFATGNVKSFEREQMKRLGIMEIPLGEVQATPAAAAQRAVEWASRFERLLVHLDADVLDYAKFPLAENSRRGTGLDYGELFVCLETILAAPNWSALTLTEINPAHCSDPEADLRRFASDLSRALVLALRKCH